MAYSTDNPPALVFQAVGAGGADARKAWWYSSTDPVTTVRVGGYITNADDLGMAAGDIVFVTDNDASPVATQICTVVAIDADGAADLSDGVAITATDTD